MKLYKYRNFSNPSDADFERLATILTRRLFWCASPDTLNDPLEFSWTCDYSPTAKTIDLFTEFLIQFNGRPHEVARDQATRAVDAKRLEVIAQPILQDIIQKCRDEIGLVCFGTSPDNDALWQRYGGCGAGVCVELDVPENLLGTILHRVQYSVVKIIHIDQLIRAFNDPNRTEMFQLTLLSKPTSWIDEDEIRFVSKMQKVAVVFDGSRITRVILGDALASSARQRIEGIAGALPVVTRSRRI